MMYGVENMYLNATFPLRINGNKLNQKTLFLFKAWPFWGKFQALILMLYFEVV